MNSRVKFLLKLNTFFVFSISFYGCQMASTPDISNNKNVAPKSKRIHVGDYIQKDIQVNEPIIVPNVVTDEKDGMPDDIDVSHIPDAVPRYEIRTLAGNKSPYTVLNKTYWVQQDPSGYREAGIASWYGTKFHGRKTANGERYDVYGMTAAHPTLPIPSYVRVTNTDNNRSIVVRVNDRGPFRADRIIDLSYAGAKKLGYELTGTAPVIVEYIDTSPLANSSGHTTSTQQDQIAKKRPVTTSNVMFDEKKFRAGKSYFQVGAFSQIENADNTVKKLTALSSIPSFVYSIEGLDVADRLFRVRLGPLKNIDKARELYVLLQSQGFLRPRLLDSQFSP